MPMYMRLGEVPAKRHTQFWRDGRLLTEQVSGLEGFSGKYSILFHVVIPRGTTYRLVPEGDQKYLVFVTPGQIEIPRRYRNEYGNLLEHAPYYHRDLHGPTELCTHVEQGEFSVKVRVRGGYQTYLLDYLPFNVVGWDGYVYPWSFNIADFEPKAGRIHQPPPAHQTFEGPGFVICSFCPRQLDWDPQAVPIPYNHSNLKDRK